jgi:ribose 5-phosphate isomerase B
MIPKKIHCAIGADHRGFKLKQIILQDQTLAQYIHWHDVGTDSEERTDYPIFTHRAIALIQNQQTEYAVLLCGTGIGMAIAANRFDTIYAGVAWSPEVAERGKEEDNVNVLVLPADYLNQQDTLECVTRWINATFKGDRYAHRLELIEKKSGVV